MFTDTDTLSLHQDGLTALMVATSKSNVEIVNALLRGGADVNQPHEVYKVVLIDTGRNMKKRRISSKSLRLPALIQIQKQSSTVHHHKSALPYLIAH